MHHQQRARDRRRIPDFVLDKLDRVLGGVVASFGSDVVAAAIGGGEHAAAARAVSRSIAEAFHVPFTELDLRRARGFAGIAATVATRCCDAVRRDLHSRSLPRVPNCGFAIDEVGPGTQVGRYIVIRSIGEGGFGRVFQARHARNGDAVALKAPSGSGGGEWLRQELPDPYVCADAWRFSPGRISVLAAQAPLVDELFYAEAKRLQASCEATPQLRETLLVAGRPWLVTDFVDGMTLRSRMHDTPVFQREVFAAIADGCASCGGHGDIKPENVILCRDGRVVLVDPSVAVAAEEVRTATAAYNPFLLRGEQADVQSIGIVLYEVMTGRLPFDSVPFPGLASRPDSPRVQFDRSRYLSYQPISSLRQDCPQWIERVVERCLLGQDYSLAMLAADIRRGSKRTRDGAV